MGIVGLVITALAVKAAVLFVSGSGNKKSTDVSEKKKESVYNKINETNSVPSTEKIIDTKQISEKKKESVYNKINKTNSVPSAEKIIDTKQIPKKSGWLKSVQSNYYEIYLKILVDKKFQEYGCIWMNTDYFSDSTLEKFGSIMHNSESYDFNSYDVYEIRMANYCLLKTASVNVVNTLIYFADDENSPYHLKCINTYLHKSDNSEYSECVDTIMYSGNVCVGMQYDSESENAEAERKVMIREGTDCIADSALADSSSITEIVLPDSVVSIGTGSFERSHKLKYVSLSKNLKYIQNAAFRFCWKLNEIKLPYGLLYIGHDAFRNCTLFESIDIPDSVSYIGARAFYRCINLKSVQLSVNIKTISSGMFMHCHQLEEIIIPDGVTEIESNAFAYCSNLKRISLPDGLLKIEDGAFYDCRNLKCIEVPDSVIYLGNDLFGKRKKYKTIVSSGKNKYVRSYAFHNKINWTDEFTETWQKNMLKQVSRDENASTHLNHDQ